jgi:hypothetical protein
LEAGPGWQNLGSVAGPRSRFGAQASGRAGIRRWKASGSGRIGVLDGASRVTAPVGGCAPRRPLVLVRTSEEDDSLGTRKKTPRARGRSPRGPRSGPHQDRTAPAKQVSPQAARAARGTRRATSTCFRSSWSAVKRPVTRAARRSLSSTGVPTAQAARTSGFERSSCKCTCLRVGCRSRSGASSPVSCGGVRGSRASVVRVRLRCRRGSVRWEPVSVGRRRAVCST